MTKHISHKTKILYEKWLIQRDGLVCLYCKKDIPRNQKHVHDHLNDNRGDNRLENYVRAHQSCNVAKKSTIDYQIMAQEKLKENELALFFPVEDKTNNEVSSEMQVNINSSEILEQYVAEKITVDGKIIKDDALFSAAYRCKKLTGHGSIQCMRTYLGILCCAEGPFMEAKDEETKKKIIVKRVGN